MNWSQSLALAVAFAAITFGDAKASLGADPTWQNPIIDAAFGRSRNDCETAREPFVQRLDINRDGALDAIVLDRAECYRRGGGYFSLVTRRKGAWVYIGSGIGRPRWLKSSSNGWPEFEARELHYGKACFRFYQFTGKVYHPNYLRETEPRHCRNQVHDHRPAPGGSKSRP